MSSSNNSPKAGGSLHPFFERGDQPHSRAKRELLKGSLLGFFATNMSVGSGSGDQVTYFDPFCGAGTYDGVRSEAGNGMMSGDSCEYGSPIVAIDAAMIILKRKLKYLGGGERHDDFGGGGSSRNEVRLVRFIFNDYEEAHVRHLKELVDRRLLNYWDCQEETPEYDEVQRDCDTVWYKYYCRKTNTDFILQITFYQCDFGKLNLYGVLRRDERIPFIPSYKGDPVFSFVDPFGFKIPFEKMKQLLGNRSRFVLIVFMVSSINRFKSESPRLVDAIFGEDGYDGERNPAGWRKAMEEAGGPEPKQKSSERHTDWTNRRLSALADYYCKRLRQSLDKKTAAFAMRKGKSSPKTGTLFCECFAGDSMADLQRMKTTMQSLSQQKPEEGAPHLYFTDYFHHSNIKVKLGRKTTDKDEAKVIYEEFRGKVATLSTVRAFVLQETPFPFHARALAVLERLGKITKVDTNGRKRPKFTFGAGKRQAWYWKVHFAPKEEEQEVVEEKREEEKVPLKKGKKRGDGKTEGSPSGKKKR